jgi:hypothetical protein
MENKYGPLLSITIVSITFLVVHLHQAWSAPLLIHIFLISALFGILAWSSGSLIPGILGHFIMDIFNFTFWWSDLYRQFDRQPLGITGLDPAFLIWLAVFIASVLGFVYLTKRILMAG